jgi:hypothetical protein
VIVTTSSRRWPRRGSSNGGDGRSSFRKPDMPIYRIVNDIALKEHIVSGWHPRNDW